MSESLKRVSMVLLALAITLGLSGVLTLETTNSAKADNKKVNICHATSSETNPWEAINIKENDKNHDGHVKDFPYNGPVYGEGSPKGLEGKPTKEGDAWCEDNAPEPPEEPEFKYNFTFDKVWEGDKIDESKVDVKLSFTYKKDTVTINEGEYAKVKKNAELTNLAEEVTGFPDNCTYTTDLPTSYIAFKKEKNEVELRALTDNGKKPMVDTLVVTNTVECEDEPTNPVTPEGGTETPVTPAGPTTPTQVTATPTGAVDAGAGANLVASLAGLMSSAAVVAAGVFLRKFSVVSL